MFLLALALLAESGWVIPPGREAVLVQMLDVKGLPNGCSLAGADPNKNVVKVLYTCDPAGKTSVNLELVHPEAAPPDAAARTERFAVVTKSAVPAGMVDAVAAQIRANETKFEWVRAQDRPPEPPRAQKFPMKLVVIAAAIALAALALVAVVRRNAAMQKR
jgi:hypothetical protein